MRGASDAGFLAFIVTRWLLSVCNVPAACGWLSGISSLLAVACLVVFLGPGAPRHNPVFGRRAAPWLALTCAVSLVADGLTLAAGGRFPWQTTFIDGVDLLAWIWFVCAGLAVARWLWGGLPAVSTRPFQSYHVAISALIALALGLQLWALFRDRPTLWPFVDYPLYSAAHGTPIRAVHHRLYGLTADEPVRFVEITADALQASWFVYHTQVIPQLFNRPALVLEDFQQTLKDASFPPLQLVLPERTTFALVDSRLEEFAERRVVPLEQPGSDARAGDPGEPARSTVSELADR